MHLFEDDTTATEQEQADQPAPVSVEDAEESTEGAGEEVEAKLQAEVEQSEVDPQASEDPAPEKDTFFQTLEEGLGEIPEEAAKQVLDGLDAKVLQKMDPAARTIIKHVLAAKGKAEREAASTREGKIAEREAALKAQEAKIEADYLRLARERKRLGETFNSKGVQELLQRAKDAGDPDAIDPMTSDGQRKLAEINAAKAFEEFAKPIAEQAKRAAAEERYLSVVQKYPVLKSDPSFKKEVAAQIRAWREAGRPVAGRLEDAVQMVHGQRAVKARTERQRAEVKTRAAAAAKVHRRTASGRVDQKAIPDEIVAKLRTDPAAFYRYIQDNPEAAEAAKRELARAG